MFLIAFALLQAAPTLPAEAQTQEELPQAAHVSQAVEPIPVVPPAAFPTILATDPQPPPIMAYPPPPTPSFFSSVPKPRTNSASWVGSYDYPLLSMLLDESGRSQFRLAVDAAGKVTACTIIGSSGFDRLDQLTCKLVSRRARFNPALDRAGVPIASNYTQAVRWVLPDSDPLRAKDFDWKRPAEAKKLKQRGTVGFEVRIAEDGAIISCRITRSSGHPLLDAETCTQLRAVKSRSIARDETGKPVARTVRNRISW